MHPLSRISNPKVEKEFLEKLYDIVPKNINVTVVTDAGFRAPWFKVVKQLGWHFVGRLRSRVQFNFGDNVWHKTTSFNGKISGTPVFLGCAELGKTKKLMDANIYAYQGTHKGRKKKRRKYYNDGRL